MKDKLQHMFLDWFNNFLSVSRFAEYYGISDNKARRVIELGRKIHESRVKS